MRKRHTAQFKARVVLEALQGSRPVGELTSKFGVHPVQIAHWKRQVVEGVPSLFGNGHRVAGRDEEALVAELYQQIGRLKMELEWLKKKTGLAD
jgi:transposase-like protein